MILRVYIPRLLVLYACVGVTITLPIEQCRQTYNTSTGRTCRYCAPGTHKHGDCLQNNGSALCLTCNANKYQGYCNIAESCATCDPRCLKPFTVKVKECTLYENILCECMEGRYWYKESDFDGLCLEHDPCGVGMGMVKLGNKYNNTQCAMCVYGETYSAEESFERCQTCTRCHKYESNCTDTSDAVCLSPWQSTSPPVPTSTPPLDELFSKVEIIVAAVVPSALLIVLNVVMACICWRYRRKIGKYIISETHGGDLPLQPRSGPVVGVENESNVNNVNRPAPNQAPPPQQNSGPVVGVENESNVNNVNRPAPNQAPPPQQNSGPVVGVENESNVNNEIRPASNQALSSAKQDETDRLLAQQDSNTPTGGEGRNHPTTMDVADKRGIAETNDTKAIIDSDYSLRKNNNNNTRNIAACVTKKTPTSKDPQN